MSGEMQPDFETYPSVWPHDHDALRQGTTRISDVQVAVDQPAS